jgi:transcriptional regulator with XRE-family HTH domain
MPQRTFGELLKKKRQELSLTQRALAGRLGITAAHVAWLESGARKPSLTLLQRIADTLDLDARKLFPLSYPAEARCLRESRNNVKSEKSAWQRLAGNRALRARERVSPAEMKVLREISRLGRVSSERQLLFVLKSVRLAFEEDPQRW